MKRMHDIAYMRSFMKRKRKNPVICAVWFGKIVFDPENSAFGKYVWPAFKSPPPLSSFLYLVHVPLDFHELT